MRGLPQRERERRPGAAARHVQRAVELRGHNRLQAAALVAGLLALAAGLAHVLLGPAWIPWLAGLFALGLLGAGRLPSAALMRLTGAVPLDPHAARPLYEVAAALCARAGLARVPRLYWLPRALLNSYAVGVRGDAAIALSDGLLRTLTPREVTAVLAHEIAHVRGDDMGVMLLAEIAARFTRALALLGIFLALVNAPLVLTAEVAISWWLIGLLTLSPSLSVLLQLALSRSRERAADLVAVELTGDPLALASALRKIGDFEAGLLEKLVLRARHAPESSWLRTHPATAERVRVLLALAEPDAPREELGQPGLVSLLGNLPTRSPRRYFVR